MILYVKNTVGKDKLDLSGLTPGFRREQTEEFSHVQLLEDVSAKLTRFFLFETSSYKPLEDDIGFLFPRICYSTQEL